MHQGSQQHPVTSMDGNRVGPSSIPVSGVDLRHHLQQREQTSWRAVQVPDTEVPADIRHPPPMLHKDHQQQTILWSNAAGMSGAMPGMQPNMPPHMPTNMPHMQGPNMPGLPPNMTAGNMAPNMTNVSQSMQAMGLPHTTQAEQLHNYHREEMLVERNGEQVMGGGVMVEEQDDLARKKDKEGRTPKEKGGKKTKKPPKEKNKTTPAQGDANNKPAERKASKAKVCACERCGKGFVSWQNMKIHYTNVHKEDGLCVEKQYNTKCPHEGCGKSFFHRKTMLKHLEQDHGVKTEQEHFEFESMDKFLDWKENEEADNHVYFVKQRGLRFHKGWYDQHYYCQRDGSARAHVKKGQPERKTNRRAKKGVTKTGIACPAKMSVKYQKGERKVSVIYTKTHSHPINILDTQFHPIPKRTIAQLSEQFAKGVPVKQVHREIKNVVSQYLQKDTDQNKPDEVQKQEEEKEKEKTEVEEGEKSNEENKEQSPNLKQDLIPQETPQVVRILNKRQLHAIKVQADTARIRDACQKLVSVFERSARVRKKLLDHATQTVEDLLEDCISVALAPSSSPAKRSRGGRRTSAKRRKVQLKNVIQEAAEQENIPSDVQEVEIGKIEESMIEDTDEVPTEIEATEESPSKEREEEEVPADEQTVEIPLTNLSEARQVQLQEALPEEESCVVTLLAQMEGQTVIDYYRDKDPNVQPVVTEVRTYSGMGSGDESNQNQSYQVLIDQPSDSQSQQ